MADEKKDETKKNVEMGTLVRLGIKLNADVVAGLLGEFVDAEKLKKFAGKDRHVALGYVDVMAYKSVCEAVNECPEILVDLLANGDEILTGYLNYLQVTGKGETDEDAEGEEESEEEEEEEKGSGDVPTTIQLDKKKDEEYTGKDDDH